MREPRTDPDLGSKPIEDYAMIGDLETGALVATDGSIDWLCLPRFDSPACFAALLGHPEHGHWSLAPQGGGPCTRRRYLDGTLVLETTWVVPSGEVRVIDLMTPRDDAADVCRLVEGVRGRVPISMTLRLRFDYGRSRPWVRREGSRTAFVAGADAAWLSTPVPLEHRDGDVFADFTVGEGQRVAFVLTHRPSHLPAPDSARAEWTDTDAGLDRTVSLWREWIGRCRYRGPHAAAVERSLVLLKALTYAPTGGIVAAATTSLPERLGGMRNWDYRFCWLRDATFVLQALVETGYTQEARSWREWLIRAVAGDPGRLQIMYTLHGSPRLSESTLPHLPGYGGSRPVRIGNAAGEQLQLDVWGEVLIGLHLARSRGLQPMDAAWEVQRGLLDWLEGHWHEPDNGLWEMRGDRRHFVHSKALVWAGVDRAIRGVEHHGLAGPIDDWRALAQTIHDEVTSRGFDRDRGTFTQYYGSQALDAALLQLPRIGFVSWDDPRTLGTIRAIEKDLLRDGLLVRYDVADQDSPDPIPHGEGTFLACSFWYVDALHATGRGTEAEELFRRLLSLRNDVGMLSEEYDVEQQRQLGNTPQAFSLVSLVNTAVHLAGQHQPPPTSKRT